MAMVAKNPIVFVVDDDQAVRKSLEMLITSVGLHAETFPSAQDFLNAYDPSRPGCLVLDVRMPGMSGLELQKSLKDRSMDVPTIIITGHGDVPVAVRALKSGAFEFLEKPFSKQMLLEHIREALNKDAENRSRRTKQDEDSAKFATLTEREKQVMELVVEGKVNKQIAAKLGLSKKTVEVHRGHVMHKLKVESVAELVELVITSRLPRIAEPPAS
jgi:FixJ family two-component response regulator